MARDTAAIGADVVIGENTPPVETTVEALIRQYNRQPLNSSLSTGDLVYWDATAGAWVRVAGTKSAGQLPVAQADGTVAWGNGSSRVVRKTADESVSASTVLQNDDHLLVAIGANELWVVDFTLFVSSTSVTPDFKAAVTAPTGAGGYWSFLVSMVTSATGNQGAINPATNALGSAASAASFNGLTTMRLTAVVNNGATAGNIQLQWAQDVSDAAAVTVKEHSFLVARRGLTG